MVEGEWKDQCESLYFFLRAPAMTLGGGVGQNRIYEKHMIYIDRG